MVLGWLGRDASINDLIARRKYAKAIQLLTTEFRQGRRDPRLRLQLADVLVMAGREKEAVPVLRGLADQFALEGFAAKAISVLKKVQRIDPRPDVERKLAALIKEKRETAGTGSMITAASSLPSFDIEEIGIEPPAESPPAAAAAPSPPPAPERTPPVSVPFTPPPSESAELEPRTAGSDVDWSALGDELLNVIHDVLSEPPAAEAPREVADSPLFSAFSREELAAVIGGLELKTYEAGDIIITEGEPGSSLFVLTAGIAKAFVRDGSGRSRFVREMEEGSFFGEISILSGQPRTATVTAKTPCELLELDRGRLDGITASQPRVLDVLKKFYAERIETTAGG